MRVLYLTMNPNRESTTVPTEGWFRILRARGLQPVLVSSKSGAFQTWAREQGVPCYDLPLPFPDLRRPWTFASSLARLWRIARRHRIDLIHCNEHDVYPIGQYLARLTRLPIAVTVHFNLETGYSHWAFGGSRCPSRMYFVSHASLEASRPGVDVVPASRRRVLHNGIPVERYTPDPQKAAAFRREHRLGDARLIGVACALRDRKQLEHLFKMAAESSVPGFRVVVAGGPVPGDEAYAERLMAEGRALLGERLLHVGHLTDLRPMLNALDLFVNTSREESFGIGSLEANACGCPVVGYPSVSVGEVILPDGGEIVPQNDVAALSVAVSSWLTAPDRLAAARVSARRQAERFDINRLAHEMWDDYQTLVHPSKSATAAE